MTVMMTRLEDARPLRASSRKREISIRGLLEWAFQKELASLDFDEAARETGAAVGVGMEWIMMERAKLGCRVDGGGRSDPHHDADIVAGALAVLPESCGGRPMAIWIAELARSGLTPDWMPDAQPRCEPLEWRACKHGRYAQREFCRALGQRWPSHQITGNDWGYWCPVVYQDTAMEVARARREYTAWRLALLELRNTFQTWRNLTAFEVTDELPDRAPWTRGLTRTSLC